jgi:2-dehydro-3-deoxygluconokinase
LGRRCAWVSGLPANPLGRLVANRLRMAGVDLAQVVWCETGRMGSYYVELAAPPRPTQVFYDRANSCAAELDARRINWDYLLDTRLVHLTGVTPALSATCRALVAETVARAKAARVPISFDINYRQKLWTETEAAGALTPLIQNIDLLFCGQADARRLFGFTGSPQQVARSLAALSGARNVVVSLGEGGAAAWDGAQFWHEPALQVNVVDRLGAGDGLAAGVIHGWLEDDLAGGLRCGVVLAALALSQHGDMLVFTREEVESLRADAKGGLLR